jgi:MFS family permease
MALVNRACAGHYVDPRRTGGYAGLGDRPHVERANDAGPDRRGDWRRGNRLLNRSGHWCAFLWFATDRIGRKKLFYATLLIYLVGTGLTALSVNFITFAFFRFIAGMGIGGEYSAINSAIDELIPARVRGQVDLVINSTYWAGAMLGALGTYVILNPQLIPPAFGWRLSFLIGALLGLLIQTLAWSVIFFIASAAASSAYLTVSEIFPLEIRGLAIAIFYACGTFAGATAPTIFGAIIGSGSREALFLAYCFAGAMMVLAALVAAFLGVKAERKSLEEIATPLSQVLPQARPAT